MTTKTAYERSKGTPYAETFRCPGGRLCLDFCNSGQGARGQGGEEWIASFRHLVDWLEAADALPRRQAAALRAAARASPESAEEIWSRAIRMREALFRLLQARTEDRAASPADLGAIEAEFARTAASARLSWTGESFGWSVDASGALDAALRPIVACAVGLLTSEKLPRVRRCCNSTCYWLFLDETKNRSRRWCEMASCGNVMKARRHREKARRAMR